MEKKRNHDAESNRSAVQSAIGQQAARLLKNDRILRAVLIAAIVLVAFFAINYYLGDPLQIVHVCEPSVPAEAAVPAAPTDAPPAPTEPPPTETQAPETPAPLGSLEAYFIDIGQGDCIYLEAPDGTTMLIDAGDRGNFPVIDAFLKEHEVERLDAVVATHMHADHIGSMAQVIDSYDIGTFYMPDRSASSNCFEDMMDALRAKSVPIETVKLLPSDTGPKAIDWADGVEVLALSPFDGQYGNENDYSIVLRVALGETALMLTGDAETTAERILLKALPHHYVKANVLKAGHHGSTTSTCEQFLSKVAPEIAVISCGTGNKYGHPEQPILERLERAGAAVYRTDLLGTIHISLDGIAARVVE